MKHPGKSWLLWLTGFAAVCCYLFLIPDNQSAAWASASASSDAPTIVLDPGHGGEDSGALGDSQVPESEINLSVSLRLEQLLHFLGLKTAMTRTEDRAVYSEGCRTLREMKRSDLKNRVEMVNAVPHALLISIHQNHFSEPQYSGAQVFYSRSLKSQQLAEALQQELIQFADPNNDRQCKAGDSVYLLKHIHCPGVLVECGFLSNPTEERMLQSASYQIKLAAAIAGGIHRYLKRSAIS